MKRLDIIKGVALPVGMLLIMGLIMFVERKGISADVAPKLPGFSSSKCH